MVSQVQLTTFWKFWQVIIRERLNNSQEDSFGRTYLTVIYKPSDHTYLRHTYVHFFSEFRSLDFSYFLRVVKAWQMPKSDRARFLGNILMWQIVPKNASNVLTLSFGSFQKNLSVFPRNDLRKNSDGELIFCTNLISGKILFNEL